VLSELPHATLVRLAIRGQGRRQQVIYKPLLRMKGMKGTVQYISLDRLVTSNINSRI
jgi:hypothetical protein